jgi:hypothetical protein
MRIRSTLAVAVSGCALAASVAIPAAAGPATHAQHARPALSHGTLHSTISTTHAKTGTKLTLKVTGAKKKTNYLCLFALVKGANKNYPNLTNTAHPVSSKKGKFSCTLTFKPFKEGKFACPLNKAAKKAKLTCGFAAADPVDQNSNAFWALKVT